MSKTVMLDIPATAEERYAQTQLRLEAERRMEAVVDAAVEWHQAGREGAEWFDRATVLENAIDRLLELRSAPTAPTAEVEQKCVKCKHDARDFRAGACRYMRPVFRPDDATEECGCECVFPAQPEQKLKVEEGN